MRILRFRRDYGGESRPSIPNSTSITINLNDLAGDRDNAQQHSAHAGDVVTVPHAALFCPGRRHSSGCVCRFPTTRTHLSP